MLFRNILIKRSKLFWWLPFCLLIIIIFSLLIKLGVATYLQPVAIVVPHHDIVKNQRLEFFKDIAQNRPFTNSIILISPDHFSPNQYLVSFADKEWQTFSGILTYDKELGSKVAQRLDKQNGLVANDHGITNLIPDLQAVWPKAKIVPILIGQKIKAEDLNGLLTTINQECKYDCLLITSVDFSHYLPSALAQIHDLETISSLTKIKVADIKNVEVDSPQSLYLLTSHANFKEAKTWVLANYTDASRIQNFRDTETTTHIFGGYKRSFINDPHVTDPYTFLISKHLNKTIDSQALGERFFYGVDLIKTNLGGDLTFGEKVIIRPVNNQTSSLKIVNNSLEINLADDLTIAGSWEKNSYYLILLPIQRINSVNSLLRGQEKTQYLEKIFKSLNSQSNMIIDKYNGTIVIK